MSQTFCIQPNTHSLNKINFSSFQLPKGDQTIADSVLSFPIDSAKLLYFNPSQRNATRESFDWLNRVMYIDFKCCNLKRCIKIPIDTFWAIALEMKWVHTEKEIKSLIPVGLEPRISGTDPRATRRQGAGRG